MKPREDGLPLLRIAIVGRPNVGKSALFNRLLGRRRSLVHDMAGVTRDRIIEQVEWTVGGVKRPLELIDTGGLGEGGFRKEIAAQVKQALSDVHAVLWVLDSREGVTNEDRSAATMLRQWKRAETIVIPIANKVDTPELELKVELEDLYEFGFETPMGVSAEHARGILDLQERIMDELADAKELRTEEGIDAESRAQLPRVAIVGRPNVGKSTLINALLGHERVVTSPIAGTTVDMVDLRVRIGDLEIELLDTAGVRRKSKTDQGIEVLSVLQTKKALEGADVAILVLDGEEGPTDQDEKVAGLIEESGCSVIVIVNKWDLHGSRSGFNKDEAAIHVRASLKFLQYAPLVFTSALKREGLEVIEPALSEVLEARRTQVPTHELTELVRERTLAISMDSAKVYMCHQVGRNPPSFAFHVNDPKKIHFSLERHLIKAIRERWGFMGSPVRVKLVKAKAPAARTKQRSSLPSKLRQRKSKR